MKGLQDKKVALVTGGSPGIGPAIAIGLGYEGASVAISYAGGPEGAKTRRRPMTRLNVTDARCAALFASGLQRSDTPDAGMVAEVISHAVRQFGTRGCAWPDGTRVRRPPRNGRRPDAVDSAACGRGVRPGHRVAGEPGRAAAGRSLPRAGPASRRQRPARRLIGNNGPVSTARASSFLNCAGGVFPELCWWRGGTGWSLAWPERVAGVARPLVHLAAPVSPGLPGVPGPLRLRDGGGGQPLARAEGPQLTVRHLTDKENRND